MPLSKNPQEKPTGREKGPNTETHILAQYVEQRDAKIKSQSMAGKTKEGFQSTQKVVEVPTDKGDNQTEHVKEKAGLLEQLQAEKKKREVLRAEKTILETKHNTVQKMVETERRKTHSLETRTESWKKRSRSLLNCACMQHACFMHASCMKMFLHACKHACTLNCMHADTYCMHAEAYCMHAGGYCMHADTHCLHTEIN